MSKTAVVFILIGMAQRYDGTETVVGNHAHLKLNPLDNSEAQAFVAESDGHYYCGAGRGAIHERKLNIVFVALNHKIDQYQIVGIYKNAVAIPNGEWTNVKTKDAILIHPEKRPILNGWIAGRNMRRWAQRIDKDGEVHPNLLLEYKKLSLKLQAKEIPPSLDEELTAFEGKQQKLFILHRQRESKLRAAKIRSALKFGDGKLCCEVPACGFDFLQKYGELGRRFAVVHHLKPLSELKSSGQIVSMDDLAIVCANCHAMIHRGGECRPLQNLITS